MKFYLIQVAVAVVSVTTKILCAAQTTCLNVTEGKNNGGSCIFTNSGLCGWKNINGDDLDWEFEDNTDLGVNSYMSLPMRNVQGGKKGLFESPTLCATGSDVRSLRFRYSIQIGNRCLLSAFLVNEGGSIKVWSTKNGTGSPFSSKVDPILFRCPDAPFKILFVGEKLTSKQCGWRYNEISLDTIEYTTSSEPSTTSEFRCPALPVTMTTTTTQASPTTTTDRDDSVSTETSRTTTTTTTAAESNPQTDSDDGLSGGAVAGIVIVVLVIIIAIILIVGVLFLRRRRAKENQEADTRPMKHSMSITNSVYMINNSPHLAVRQPQGTGRSNNNNIPPIASTGWPPSLADNRLSNSHYDVVAAAGSPSDPGTDIYSVPDDDLADGERANNNNNNTSNNSNSSSRLSPSAPLYDTLPQRGAVTAAAYYSTPPCRDSDTYEAVAGDIEYSLARDENDSPGGGRSSSSSSSQQQPPGRDSECYSLATSQPETATATYYSVQRSSGGGGGGGSETPPSTFSSRHPPSAGDEEYSLAQHVPSSSSSASGGKKSAAVKPEKRPRGQRNPKPDSLENEYANVQEVRGSSPRHQGGRSGFESGSGSGAGSRSQSDATRGEGEDGGAGDGDDDDFYNRLGLGPDGGHAGPSPPLVGVVVGGGVEYYNDHNPQGEVTDHYDHLRHGEEDADDPVYRNVHFP